MLQKLVCTLQKFVIGNLKSRDTLFPLLGCLRLEEEIKNKHIADIEKENNARYLENANL